MCYTTLHGASSAQDNLFLGACLAQAQATCASWWSLATAQEPRHPPCGSSLAANEPGKIKHFFSHKIRASTAQGNPSLSRELLHQTTPASNLPKQAYHHSLKQGLRLHLAFSPCTSLATATTTRQPSLIEPLVAGHSA